MHGEFTGKIKDIHAEHIYISLKPQNNPQIVLELSINSSFFRKEILMIKKNQLAF